MVRTVEVKFRILRDGAQAGEIHALDTGSPTLRMSADSEIKTSLSGDFVASGDFDWVTCEIQPVLIINGEETPLGVFLPATVQELEDETTKSVHIEAYDRCWRVQDHYTESYYYIPAGTNYIEAVKQLLAAAGIGGGLDTPTTSKIAYAREDWDLGPSYLTIVNQLLSEINYKPLWFNSAGLAVLEPEKTPTSANVQKTMDSSNVKSMLLPQISRETDLFSTPNVFICIVSNADRPRALVATAENKNPQSPLSIPRRKRRIAAVYRVDNVPNQEELQAYADRLRNQSLIGGESITVQTALLPGYGVGDVVALHYGDISDICIEKAWTMALRTGGNMTHTLERVVINLD